MRSYGDPLTHASSDESQDLTKLIKSRVSVLSGFFFRAPIKTTVKSLVATTLDRPARKPISFSLPMAHDFLIDRRAHATPALADLREA